MNSTTITLSLEDLRNILALITAFAAVVALVWKGFKWLDKQGEQSDKIQALEEDNAKLRTEMDDKIATVENKMDSEINKLREQHEKDISIINDHHKAAVDSIQEEQTLLVYGLLACLKGLEEQGCDGPVSEAIDKMEKHINKRAHGQI